MFTDSVKMTMFTGGFRFGSNPNDKNSMRQSNVGYIEMMAIYI